ncbi:MAG: hypothetical protein RLZZ488_2282 [Pseudomonadota bacterium]|jgi:two-component system chemotaxis sensor kinase CheA
MELTQEMLTELKAESAELIEQFSRLCLRLNVTVEQKLAVSRDDIDALFRALHTLKSLCELMDRPRLVSALHLLEDRLTQVRAGQSVLDTVGVEQLAESQLILEKLLVIEFNPDDDVLLSELEHQAQLFCVGEESHVQAQEPSVASVGQTDSVRPLSEVEKERWVRYQSRDEFIFALSAQGDAGQCRAVIEPVGDVLIERVNAAKFLLVFAAELDQTLVEAIVEQPVRPLQKDLQALNSLGAEWSGLLSSAQKSELSTSASAEFAAAAELSGESSVDDHEIEPTSPADSDAPPFEQMGSADPEMVSDFLSNASELLETLTQSLLELEANPSDSSTIETIFRAAHTIKGTAGMLGFSVIEKLCHALENTFDRIRKNQLEATPVLIDQLLVGWDLVRELFSLLQQGRAPQLPIDGYLKNLSNAEKGVRTGETSTPSPEAKRSTDDQQAQTATMTPAAQKSDAQATLRVDLKKLDSLVNLVGELVIDRTRFARIEEAMRTRGASADLSHQMAESLLLFGRHMNEVQNIIMKVRMVPVGNVFYKFARMVRDLSRQVGKEVDLVIEGGETELDKTLVEEIGDPLVHLIRNSIDHGIESADVREAAGKSRRGQIRISAAQQGNMIVICVEDNGKGLDVERIRAKAIKNGLLREHDNPEIKDIFNLIFEPGFSTAEKVTNISGRGVGMDVVKKNIQKLKGVIEIDSVVGQGTKIQIKLPITLAIVPSLFVEVNGESFAVPLVNVIESIRIDPAEIQYMGSSQFVRLREQVIPLVRFADVLGMNTVSGDFWYREATKTPTLARRRDRLVFVVVGVGPERIGLVVDKLIGQQEIVIKPLGRLLSNQSGVAGGCLLGDGRVALVLDILEVFNKESAQRYLHDRRSS